MQGFSIKTPDTQNVARFGEGAATRPRVFCERGAPFLRVDATSGGEGTPEKGAGHKAVVRVGGPPGCGGRP